MSVWICRPGMAISSSDLVLDDAPVDDDYLKIRAAFGYHDPAANREGKGTRHRPLTVETLAAQACQRTIGFAPASGQLCVLVDCRSTPSVGGPAPSYRLASQLGLSSALTFALGGQAGTEVVQALIFLKAMAQSDVSALILASQQVPAPDKRIWQNGTYPLADGVAAVAVHKERLHPSDLNLLGAAIRQYRNWQEVEFDTFVQELVLPHDLSVEDVRWTISHHVSPEFITAVGKQFPKARHYIRQQYCEYNFGCADTLITWSEIPLGEGSEFSGTGVAWFVGRFGSVGALLLT